MNKSNLFKSAHETARNTVKIVGNYSIAFSLALKDAYKATVNAVVKVAKTLEERALELGGKVWTKNDMSRIYINLAAFNEICGCSCRLNETKNKFYVEDGKIWRRYNNKKPKIELA